MTITVNGGDGSDGSDAAEDVRHLYRWLRDADQLRYDARVELASAEAPDGAAMGPALDVIDIVLASGFSAASLAATLAMWRSSRPRAGSATLMVGATTVTVQDGSPETIRAIVDALTATPRSVPAPTRVPARADYPAIGAVAAPPADPAPTAARRPADGAAEGDA
ncbi:effector-associated constant component EACC1 [Streptodolium elevatio]